MGFKLSPASSARKWLGFVTAVWVQAIAGNNYTFSNYSDALKSLMSLTQLELNSLSVAKDVGKAFGLLAGLASDRLSTPAVLLIGSIEGFVGYGVQWLVVSRRIHPLPYWQVCIFTNTRTFCKEFWWVLVILLRSWMTVSVVRPKSQCYQSSNGAVGLCCRCVYFYAWAATAQHGWTRRFWSLA